MRGRKPPPAPLQVVRDERPDRRHKPAAAAAAPDAALPPDHLDANGRAKWSEMAAGVPAGAFTRHRAELLAIYCEAFARKLSAQADLNPPPPKPTADGSPPAESPLRGLAVVCGTGGLKPHPALRVVRECEATMLRVLGDLARLDAAEPAAKPADRLAKFLPASARKAP